MPIDQTLILIRHAHRDKDRGREANNGLSSKGHKQAKAIQKYFQIVFDQKKPVIFSSPKRRCVETVDPLSQKLGVPVKIADCLDESGTQATLRERLRQFDALLGSTKSPLIVACSHGDWIPAYVERATGVSVELDKGGWIELEIVGERKKFRGLLQDVNSAPR